MFPWFVYALVSLAVLIHISGYIQEACTCLRRWDVLAHTVLGNYCSLIGFLVILFWDKIKKLQP